MIDFHCGKLGNKALQSSAERWHDAHEAVIPYNSAHVHNFQPTETLRDTIAKKDEDADLVVEIRRTLRSRQLQHG